MRVSGLDYVAVLAVTVALTVGLTPLMLRLAVAKGVLDRPSEIKAQASPVPYLGGVAIVVSFAVVILLAAVIRPPFNGLGELALILGLAVLLGVVGLVDDLRGLSPWLRLAIEAGSAVAVWSAGAGAEVFDVSALNLVITVLWVVGVTNAVNFLDNMDGLSAGVSSIAAFTVFVLAAQGGQFLVATLAIALAGCAGGFLRSNFHPARIYMGDAGALFIGFLLAVLCTKLRFPDAPRAVGALVPILVLGVPLFDTTLVFVNRIRHHLNPMMGGRDHTSHRLVFLGISVRGAVAAIYVAALSLGGLAFVLSRSDLATGLVLVGWLALLGGLAFGLLARVPVYATSRRRHLMLMEVLPHEGEPEVDDASATGTIESA